MSKLNPRPQVIAMGKQLSHDLMRPTIAVMMKSNYSRLADVARVAKRFGAPLRVNVYQAVRSDLYALTYEE